MYLLEQHKGVKFLKIQAFEIDELGFLLEIYVIDSEEETELITTKPPNGLYKAKWTGLDWIEGLPQEELDEIEYQQYLDSLKPSDEEIKNAQLELVILNLLIDMEVM